MLHLLALLNALLHSHATPPPAGLDDEGQGAPPIPR